MSLRLLAWTADGGEQGNDGRKKRGQIHERKATWMEEKSDGQAACGGGSEGGHERLNRRMEGGETPL